MRKWLALWLGSLVLVAVVTSGLTVLAHQSGRAQVPTPRDGPAYPLTPPRIVSGADIGFKVEGLDIRGNPTGTWLLRLDGVWFEVSTMPTTRRVND
ncbi:MAG: hypothetical protein DMF89_17375 [Acidobacteria bacterium]|nr:MAG: hypothetical protein DMF89_17375 [Acidobacteriota bacterium]